MSTDLHIKMMNPSLREAAVDDLATAIWDTIEAGSTGEMAINENVTRGIHEVAEAITSGMITRSERDAYPGGTSYDNGLVCGLLIGCGWSAISAATTAGDIVDNQSSNLAGIWRDPARR